MRFTLCEDTGMLAVEGACPAHGGDACLAQFVEVPEPEDQEWIDALQEEAPGQMDEDQLMAYVRHVLVRASNETATGEDGPTFHEVRKAIECMDQLKALQLPDPGPDYMREEYDFALGEPIDPAVVAAARSVVQDEAPVLRALEFPPIRKLPDAEPRVEQGPVQFGEQWPGLYLNGKSCILYAGALASELERPGHGLAVEKALDSLLRDLRSALLKPGDPRR